MARDVRIGFKPSAAEFSSTLRKFTLVSSQISANMCKQLRDRVVQVTKNALDSVNADKLNLQAVKDSSATQAEKDAAVADVEKAFDDAKKEFTTLSDKYLKLVNDNCEKLAASDAYTDINSEIDKRQTTINDAATKLSEIPGKFEKEMQTHIDTLEKVTGPV